MCSGIWRSLLSTLNDTERAWTLGSAEGKWRCRFGIYQYRWPIAPEIADSKVSEAVASQISCTNWARFRITYSPSCVGLFNFSLTRYAPHRQETRTETSLAETACEGNASPIFIGGLYCWIRGFLAPKNVQRVLSQIQAWVWHFSRIQSLFRCSPLWFSSPVWFSAPLYSTSTNKSVDPFSLCISLI